MGEEESERRELTAAPGAALVAIVLSMTPRAPFIITKPPVTMREVLRTAAVLVVLVSLGVGSWAGCAPDAVLRPTQENDAGGAAGAAGQGGQSGGGQGGEGGAPLECNSEYTDVPNAMCDLLWQDCPPPKRCTVQFRGGDLWSAICVDPKNAKLEGETCTQGYECEWGLACVVGRCTAVCCRDTNYPCAEGSYCLFYGSYGPYYAMRCAYLDSCELFVPGTCDTADPPGNCHLLPDYDAMVCVPGPASGPKQHGESCTSGNECDDFMACIGTNAQCRWICYLNGEGNGVPGGGGCPFNERCAQAPDLGDPTLGVCG
jgi:hypothetical protein